MIFPSNHLFGAKIQSPQAITWLVLVNKIKQKVNYNINNLNEAYKKLLNYSSKTKHNEIKAWFMGLYASGQETDRAYSPGSHTEPITYSNRAFR